MVTVVATSSSLVILILAGWYNARKFRESNRLLRESNRLLREFNRLIRERTGEEVTGEVTEEVTEEVEEVVWLEGGYLIERLQKLSEKVQELRKSVGVGLQHFHNFMRPGRPFPTVPQLPLSTMEATPPTLWTPPPLERSDHCSSYASKVE